MSKYQRLVDYIIDFFPEPKYSRGDISDWARENVPAWKVMDKGEKDKILKDWENFIFQAQVEPEIQELVRDKSPTFIQRIKNFLKRLF